MGILEAAIFDVEYGRWQDEHYRLMYELRAALQQHQPEGGERERSARSL
jgi:transcription factor TGA